MDVLPRVARTLGLGAYWIARKSAVRAARSRFAVLAAMALAPIDGKRAVLLKGTLSQLRNRNDDHLQFWTEASRSYPDDPGILRMRIHSALRAGDTETAEAGLVSLIAAGKAEIADSRFVIGLSNVDLRKNRVPAIRARVRAFLASLRGLPECRVAAVRMSRLIFAHFPRAERRGRTNAQFLHMLDRSPVVKRPKALLRRVAASELRLEQPSAGGWFDTDVSVTQCRAFVGLVRQRLHERRPFSFVRLGDGEAACLPYEPRLSMFALPDAQDRERIWWGRPLTRQARERIYPRLAQAMFDADCIGIPTVSRFVREIRLLRSDTLETTLTGRGLRAVLHCTENWQELRSAGISAPLFTSCHLHQDLELWNCYRELFDGIGDTVLVSCHEQLADRMRERFDLNIAEHILLPPDRVTGPYLDGARRGPSLPEILDEAIDRLGDLPRDRLVLVGAGLLGKLFVSEARRRGGIALDLGSIFDHWLGLRTRSYLDLNTA